LRGICGYRATHVAVHFPVRPGHEINCIGHASRNISLLILPHLRPREHSYRTLTLFHPRIVPELRPWRLVMEHRTFIIELLCVCLRRPHPIRHIAQRDHDFRGGATRVRVCRPHFG
jgi:hypothetical protein